MKTFILLLMLAANPPVYISAGPMRCGAVRRGPEDVQIWCYTGLVFSAGTSMGNYLLPVRLEGKSILRREYAQGLIINIIEWTFTQGFDNNGVSTGVLRYYVTATGAEPQTGEL